MSIHNLTKVLVAEPGLLREVYLGWIPSEGFICKIVERDPQPEFIQTPIRVLVGTHKEHLIEAIQESCGKI